MARGSAPALADDAQSVSVVHHDARAVFASEADDFGELGDVAAHAEHAVGDDQAARGFRHLLQLKLQLLHVGVSIGEHAAVAELAAVVDAGVVFLVADDVISMADDGGDDAQIGLKAGGEGAAGLLVQEIRQLRFQLKVKLQRSVEEARAGAARAVLLQRIQSRLKNLRTGGQSEIIVGAEHDPALSLHDDLHVLSGFQRVKIRINAAFAQFAREREAVAFLENIQANPPHFIRIWRNYSMFMLKRQQITE